jgi:hypothetical protein
VAYAACGPRKRTIESYSLRTRRTKRDRLGKSETRVFGSFFHDPRALLFALMFLKLLA